MFLSKALQHVKQKFKPQKQGVIIVGVDYDSFQLHQQIKNSKRFFTAFFIDEEPWNHRSYIDEAQLRYPVELRALCQNHPVAAIFCTSHEDKNRMLAVEDRDERGLTTQMLVVTPKELKRQHNVDKWIKQQLCKE